MVRTAPVAEWLYYCDYLVKKGLVDLPEKGPGPLRGLQGFFQKAF
jgi:hypothetical protein